MANTVAPATFDKEATAAVSQQESQVSMVLLTEKASVRSAPALAYFLGAIASIGGFMFGYESGQISGFLQMPDFKARFAQDGVFSPARAGTIVGFLCIGTLLGCLVSAPLANKFGRRYTISAAAFSYLVGVVIEITSTTHWYQFALGRLAAGLGIGALSTVVPMYQSESVPKSIRSAVVCSYQLFITLGIWAAYMINWATDEQYDGSAEWRIPNGLSALWAILLGSSILLMPESPRYALSRGREDEARRNMARLNGVDPNSEVIGQEIRDVKARLEAESASNGVQTSWTEVLTGPRMLYRTLLGIALMAGQQLTGANFFFYYGTSIFAATGMSNAYITSIILGSVNVAATVVGIAVGSYCGKRRSLMVGAACMFVCLCVFSFVGHFALNHVDPSKTPAAGSLMIVFTCLFIAAFATTWGPLVWAVVGELYPARYRATCVALATSSNWLLNFLISFFSPYITGAIGYLYSLVFGACCFGLIFVVYFFVIESNGRSLEEIDTMYVQHVDPKKSAKWQPDRQESFASSGTSVEEKAESIAEA